MSKYTEQQFRDATDAALAKYDTDGSHTLARSDFKNFVQAAQEKLGDKTEITQQKINEMLSALDSSGDGKVGKNELFLLLKELLA